MQVRSDSDQGFVRTVCDGLDIDFDNVVENVFRDGRVRSDKSNHCRIVKIKFNPKAKEDRMKFLKKLRYAKPGDVIYGKTYVRPDLTFRQREADRVMVQELFVRRQQEPDLIIRDGKIVKRRPQVGRAHETSR